MRREPQDTKDAGIDVDEIVLTTPDGHALPRVLDRGVTMDLVQRYVETERNRSRRLLLWTGSIFFFVIMLVLVLFISVGVFVLRNSRRAVEQVEQIHEQTALTSAELVTMSGKLDDINKENDSVRTMTVEMETKRHANDKVLKNNLMRFHKWILQKDEVKSSDLSVLKTRMEEMEKESLRKQNELEALEKRYMDLLQSLSGSLPQMETENRNGVNTIKTDASQSDAQTGSGSISGDMVIVDNDATDEKNEAIPDSLPQSDENHVKEILVVTFSNGDRYEGEFKNGLFHGWGTYYYRNGDRYDGEFRHDMKHGKGTLTYKNGDKYTGEFRKDMKEGRGSLEYGNGDRYVGDFKNGMIDGKGIMQYANGNKYEGDFRNGLRHGNGSFRFSNGDVYEGEFVDDVRHGKGTYVFNNGAKYIGSFKEGKKHGRGRYVYASGEEYVGNFKDGAKDGEGVCLYPNGKKLKGLWQNDVFVRVLDS
ncbi:MAG: hypothetical protein JXN60_08220 [Lentisphaerae bacterium]|nr:hypothetical protein [Lentisphaerota bacterium]